MTNDITQLQERVQTAKDEADDRDMRWPSYCIDCDELYDALNVPDACFNNHQLIRDNPESNSFGNWIACIEYVRELTEVSQDD